MEYWVVEKGILEDWKTGRLEDWNIGSRLMEKF
jgi:hypothetical protein